MKKSMKIMGMNNFRWNKRCEILLKEYEKKVKGCENIRRKFKGYWKCSPYHILYETSMKIRCPNVPDQFRRMSSFQDFWNFFQDFSMIFRIFETFFEIFGIFEIFSRIFKNLLQKCDKDFFELFAPRFHLSKSKKMLFLIFFCSYFH